jgi:divalent metal cation (Fe/Co/Zn/Cd) transporter
LQPGSQALLAAGAHVLIESVAQLPLAIERIEQRIAQGEMP